MSTLPKRFLRLDTVQQPYGPCPAALEAIDALPEFPAQALAPMLVHKLAAAYRVPSGRIFLAAGVESTLDRLVAGCPGPIVAFPPSASAAALGANHSQRPILHVCRGPGRDQTIDADIAADLPADGLVLIESPSDPLGAVLSTTDAVRLARACRLLVIDERFAEFSGMSLLPLAFEFDNIVIVRSFETWAAIQSPPCAWLAASRRAAELVGLGAEPVERGAIAAAMATLDNLASLDVTLRLLRDERSRLYRFLRKLSFIEPIPSWGPFLAARVTLVSRQAVVSGLLTRGIRVHAPPQPGLEQVIRIGIGSRTAMDRFAQALLDLAPELVAGPSGS